MAFSANDLELRVAKARIAELERYIKRQGEWIQVLYERCIAAENKQGEWLQTLYERCIAAEKRLGDESRVEAEFRKAVVD